MPQAPQLRPSHITSIQTPLQIAPPLPAQSTQRPSGTIRGGSAAHVAAGTAVVTVKVNADAGTAAWDQSAGTFRAVSIGAVRRRSTADVAAGPAVLDVPVQERACAVTVLRAFVTLRPALAVLAPAILVGTRFIADVAAGPAVVLIPVDVRAYSIAADGPVLAMIFAAAVIARGLLVGTSPAAFVKAGSAVPRVACKIRADVASRTIPAEKPGVRIALAALGQALRLLALVAAFAEGSAQGRSSDQPRRVLAPRNPGQPRRMRPQTAQRFAAGKRFFSDGFGKFVPML